jgi:glycosyltransferase involved in cell wall biosynthesis
VSGRRPRRVLFVHSSAGRYGADRQLHLLATGLDPDRAVALVLLPFEGPLADGLRGAGVEVFTGPLAVLRREHLSPRGLALLGREVARQAPQLEALLRAQRVDVVHANTSVVLGLRRPARRAGARHVVHVREIYPPTPGVWPLYRRELLRADRLVCVSHAVAATFGAAGDGRVRVLHDGLAVAPSRAPQRTARLALGLPREAFVVAVLGRVSGWKGQDVLARALAEPALVERGAIGVVAGDAWPGQQRHEQALRDLAGSLGLADRLRLVGFRDDVETVYGAADVVVVPSTRPDPLPNSALEAAAAGCCVVAAGHGGLPEIVREGETGHLVAPGDHVELARVLAVLADDAGERERLGAAAAADVRERFAPARLTAAVAGLYDELS